MARTVLVKIDLSKLRANLAKADQRDVTPDEVQQFLADAGFTPKDGGWLVLEEHLGHLDPSEVISAEYVD